MIQQNAFKNFIDDCHKNLISSPNKESKSAFEYLSSRGISISSLRVHKIGYCSTDAEIDDNVRFCYNSGTQKDYSYFIKGKIIVPIYSEFQEIVSFATRTPSKEKGNTWWNYPFKKNRHIFLLDKARTSIYKSNKAYLVEGYIDAIILFQVGIKNVACLMGVNLPIRKIGLLTRYCNEICVCLDNDENESGQKASSKILKTLKQFDFCDKLSYINDTPVGEDPDVFVIKNGAKAFLDMEKYYDK